MVTTQACKDVVNLVGRHVSPFYAQRTLEVYCRDRSMQLSEFNFDDLPKLILFIASNRDLYVGLSDMQFYKLMNDLVYLSNLEERKAAGA